MTSETFSPRKNSGSNALKSYYQTAEKKSQRLLYLGCYSSTVGRVKTIDWKKYKPFRAGVIPYVVYRGKLLFCAAVDRKTGDLTDFGGGVSYKKDRSALIGALREFAEESLGAFGTFTPEDLEDCVVARNPQMAIIFLPLDCDPIEVTKVFQERYRKEKINEVSALAWMSASTLTSALGAGNIFYVRVSRLLHPVVDKVLAHI